MVGLLLLIGLIAGSFAGAQLWRQRAAHLAAERDENLPFDTHEWQRLKPLLDRSPRDDRSECLHCHHQLAWYDLVPLLSWLSTAGRCRYCRQPIGWFEPAMELGMAGLLATSYLLWPYPLSSWFAWVLLGIWLIACIPLLMIFVYDLRWYTVVFSSVASYGGLAALFALGRLLQAPQPLEAIVSLIGALAILPGLYWLLWKLSHEQWVGLGDAQIGVGLALFLADWRLALLTVFLANLLGTLLVLPLLIGKKLTRKTHIPFGPLLIAGFLISFFFGAPLIQWYLFDMTQWLTSVMAVGF